MSTLARNTDGSYSLSMTATELYAVIGQLDIGQLRIDAGQGTTTPPPPVTTPPTSTGFHGIFAFNTGNSSALASHPDIAGTELGYYWSQLELQQGQYNWDLIDNDMKPWVDNGKKVTLRVKTAGWKNWQPPFSQKGTPQWVLDQGVPFIVANDGSIKPQYWNITFLMWLKTFVKALADRYDGNKNILCIEIAVGDGGETKPDTTKDSNVLSRWQAIGYTDANWWTAIQAIITMYVLSFKETPLALMPDASFLGGTSGFDEAKVVNYATQFTIWMQWNGLVAGGKLPGSFAGLKKGYPLLLEPLNAAGQNGRKLADDLATAMSFSGVQAVLPFSSDLADPSNAATLAKFAAMASK